MTDRELLQQALDALNAVTKELLACRGELAERGARPETPHKQKLWDSAFNAYTGMAIPTYEAMRARLAQPAQEPVAWMEFEGYMDEDGLMSERKVLHTWDNGKGEPLYTAPPQRQQRTYTLRKWQGLTDEEYEAMAENYVTNCYFDTLKYARAIEAALKAKNAT